MTSSSGLTCLLLPLRCCPCLWCTQEVQAATASPAKEPLAASDSTAVRRSSEDSVGDVDRAALLVAATAGADQAATPAVISPRVRPCYVGVWGVGQQPALHPVCTHAAGPMGFSLVHLVVGFPVSAVAHTPNSIPHD
jgi:hypothetical protein